MKLHLSEEHIQSLINRYKDSQNLINYPLFCDSVEKQFYDRGEALQNLNAVKSKSVSLELFWKNEKLLEKFTYCVARSMKIMNKCYSRASSST